MLHFWNTQKKAFSWHKEGNERCEKNEENRGLWSGLNICCFCIVRRLPFSITAQSFNTEVCICDGSWGEVYRIRRTLNLSNECICSIRWFSINIISEWFCDGRPRKNYFIPRIFYRESWNICNRTCWFHEISHDQVWSNSRNTLSVDIRSINYEVPFFWSEIRDIPCVRSTTKDAIESICCRFLCESRWCISELYLEFWERVRGVHDLEGESCTISRGYDTDVLKCSSRGSSRPNKRGIYLCFRFRFWIYCERKDTSLDSFLSYNSLERYINRIGSRFIWCNDHSFILSGLNRIRNEFIHDSIYKYARFFKSCCCIKCGVESRSSFYRITFLKAQTIERRERVINLEINNWGSGDDYIWCIEKLCLDSARFLNDIFKSCCKRSRVIWLDNIYIHAVENNFYFTVFPRVSYHSNISCRQYSVILWTRDTDRSRGCDSSRCKCWFNFYSLRSPNDIIRRVIYRYCTRTCKLKDKTLGKGLHTVIHRLKHISISCWICGFCTYVKSNRSIVICDNIFSFTHSPHGHIDSLSYTSTFRENDFKMIDYQTTPRTSSKQTQNTPKSKKKGNTEYWANSKTKHKEKWI